MSAESSHTLRWCAHDKSSTVRHWARNPMKTGVSAKLLPKTGCAADESVKPYRGTVYGVLVFPLVSSPMADRCSFSTGSMPCSPSRSATAPVVCRRPATCSGCGFRSTSDLYFAQRSISRAKGREGDQAAYRRRRQQLSPVAVRQSRFRWRSVPRCCVSPPSPCGCRGRSSARPSAPEGTAPAPSPPSV